MVFLIGDSMFRLAAIFAVTLAACLCAADVASAQISEAKLEKARQLVEIQGVRKIYIALAPTMIEQLTDETASFLGRLKLFSTPLQRDVLKSIVSEDFDKIFVPQAMEYDAKVYAEEFSDSQLTEILNFYDSPTGKLYVEKEEHIIQTQIFTREILRTLFRDAMLKYCHHTNCPQPEYNLLDEATDPKPRGKPN
jgi:hypothetical protein